MFFTHLFFIFKSIMWLSTKGFQRAGAAHAHTLIFSSLSPQFCMWKSQDKTSELVLLLPNEKKNLLIEVFCFSFVNICTRKCFGKCWKKSDFFLKSRFQKTTHHEFIFQVVFHFNYHFCSRCWQVVIFVLWLKQLHLGVQIG